MFPDSKVHGDNVGPTWVLSALDGPHVVPMNLAIRVVVVSKGLFVLVTYKQNDSSSTTVRSKLYDNKYNNWCKASKLIAPPSTIKRRRIYWKVQQKISTKYFCVYINNLMCFWFLVWLQVVLNEIYQRKVELDINIKMLAPCQSALLLLRYFLSKVNIWIVNCAWATAFIFDTRTGVRQVGKVSRFFETENISTRGGLEHPTFGFMPNALTYWAIRARHLLSHVV